ncbi:MAG: TRAM domain-containing protein [Nitriliruptorales bacterium]|nr:TRAM domain-containing protein [Nitriliruptorales bacterium]
MGDGRKLRRSPPNSSRSWTKIRGGGRGYHRAVSASTPTPPSPRADERQTVTLHGFAHGGEAVGRLDDGRAVFVAHGIPGETVRVRIIAEHKRWCRGELLEVVSASHDRVQPPCPYFGPGQCGGCRLQHIATDRRLALLRQVVVDQLERLGRISNPVVAETVSAGHYGYRTRARFAVTDRGALAFRRHGSHDLIAVDRCLLLDDRTQLLREAAGDDWAGREEVEVRTAAHGVTVVVDPAGRPTVALGERVLAETVDGLTFRVSATSFFQSNRAGAMTLLRLVRSYARCAPGDTALDLYAGVGLFAAGLAADGAAVTAVESHPSSVSDARYNLRARGDVLAAPVATALGQFQREDRRFDVVVLDPPRRGAGESVISGVAAVARRSVVVVACDAATLGRDAATLQAHGWSLREAVPVDQFAQTGHVEVVACFERLA